MKITLRHPRPGLYATRDGRFRVVQHFNRSGVTWTVEDRAGRWQVEVVNTLYRAREIIDRRYQHEAMHGVVAYRDR